MPREPLRTIWIAVLAAPRRGDDRGGDRVGARPTTPRLSRGT
jgi:hypothetical protein